MESLVNPSSNISHLSAGKPAQSMPGSAVCVVIGLGSAGLGALLYFAGHNTETSSDAMAAFGMLLLVAGSFLFAIGLLVEFFAIGAALRSIAKSSEATASLLRIGAPTHPDADKEAKRGKASKADYFEPQPEVPPSRGKR